MATRTAGSARPAVTPVGAARGARGRQGPPERRPSPGMPNLLRRGLTIGLALAVLGLFAAGVVEQRWKEAQLRQQVAAERAELRAAEERNAALKEALAASSNEARRAWVETTARRQLNLAYPGETVYLVNWTAPPAALPASPAPQAAPPSAEPFWRRLWKALAGE